MCVSWLMAGSRLYILVWCVGIVSPADYPVSSCLSLPCYVFGAIEAMLKIS